MLRAASVMGWLQIGGDDLALEFTNEQMMAAMEDDADFIEWFVEEFLTEFFPEAFEGIERELLYLMTDNGLIYARRFGFTQRDDQVQFLALMNEVGPDFWRFPGFKEVIEDKDLTPDQRVKKIYETVTGEQFADAAFDSDADYWLPQDYMDRVAKELGME